MAVANVGEYFEILGLAPSATLDDARAAYRRLARRYHPDVSDSPDAQMRMQEINAAYSALRDLDSWVERESAAPSPADHRSTVHAPAPQPSPAGGASRARPAKAARPAAPAWRSAAGLAPVPQQFGRGSLWGGPGSIYAIGAAVVLGVGILAGGLGLYAGSRAEGPDRANATAARAVPAVATAVPLSVAGTTPGATAAAVQSERGRTAGPAVAPQTARAPLAPAADANAAAVPAVPAQLEVAPAAGGQGAVEPPADLAAATRREVAAPAVSQRQSPPVVAHAALTASVFLPPERRDTAPSATTPGALSRALASYDRAHAVYVSALRRQLVPTGGGPWAATTSGVGTIGLSPEAGAGVARALYLQQALAWSQAFEAAQLPAQPNGIARPAPALELQARARLQRAADLLGAVSLTSQVGNVPAAAQLLAQARDALVDAERLHQVWLAEWLAYLNALAN